MLKLNLFEEFEDENAASSSNNNYEYSIPEKESLNNSSKRKHEDDGTSDLDSKHHKNDLLWNINMEELENRVIIHTVETLEACTHEVACPPSKIYESLEPCIENPAKTYQFILDPFQKEAILCIDNQQSVLVSAHTSAGKTVVAEYAIAKSLKMKQRVIYTTPIKALSNQKFREFTEQFEDVGLITGDVTINPSASCLIMTTEILRNMLYRGATITREVGWVIFDEIHYMRDKERGVVWEETLILLPHNVRYVFLSATIPNARQFAEWVCHLHNQPCHVIYTDYRPTPLEHFLFPNGADGVHLVVDEKGEFKENNFNIVMGLLTNSGDKAKSDTQQRGRKGGFKNNPAQTNVYKVVKMIMEKNLSPVIVFSFSKKECELYAMAMAKLDFNTVEEKKLVDEIFNNAIDVLKPEDKKIPQVENVLPFLRRGIGIHHGGLLPILKETIEIMFSEGLIKALFATETFAMGLNMPARTVVFTDIKKFDGKDFRPITSGEYIQMSGRAGRRGLDEKGTVILMVSEMVTPATARSILSGQADPINSAFHLTYNMVLNLLRVDEINPEYMMERSFFQFQNQASIPILFKKFKDLESEYKSIKISHEDQLASYHQLKELLDNLNTNILGYILKPESLIPFLQPGRLIKIKHQNTEFDWGVIVNFKKSTEKETPKKDKNIEIDTKIIIYILLHVQKNNETVEGENHVFKPCPIEEEGVMEVIPVVSKQVIKLSSVRVHLPNDLRPLDNRKSMQKVLLQVKKRFSNNGPPLLDPIKDMNIKDAKFVSTYHDTEKITKRLETFPIKAIDNWDELYEQYKKKFQLKKEVESVKSELKKAKSLLQMDELKNRKKVLRRLNYCDECDVIEVKGRIACELSSADELLITELIFNGVFDNLDPPLSAALLSCFVCDEKSQQMPARAEELSGALRKMQNLARRIAKVSKESKLPIEEDEYVEGFKPFLMDVVHAWCRGSTFLEICQMTDIFEGSIIRAMRRLEELLRQLVQAAKSIGNVDLETKFNEAIKLIKRDIVFAASLYL